MNAARQRESVDLRDDKAAQLVEFAVALPLLVVFVVGIFDFSGAFTLKQKLTNAARDAARAAAADPASDLGNTSPVSVSDAYQGVKNYFAANQINDCGVGSPSPVSGTLTWKATANGNGCPSAGITLIINRGYYFPASSTTYTPVDCTSPPSVSTSQTAVISTCVSIQYPYPWQFGKVTSLLGRTTTLPNTITAEAVAMNEN